MNKTSICLLLCILLLSSLPLQAFASVADSELEGAIVDNDSDLAALNEVSYSNIASQSALLMDADTGQVLYAKNMDQKMYPASTTKIMTALLTVENADRSEYATVTETALAIDEPQSSNVGLMLDEVLTVEDALYGLMLRSANEAANVLAEHVAGSQAAFADLMNQKAREIGAMNTHFANPHGLHEDDHYTTAYDLALITRYASQNEEFSKYYSTPEYTMRATNKHPEARTISNHMYMLFDISPYYYEDVVGGKTGFTDEAQNTMSTVATRDGRTLVCVVMYTESSRDKFYDTEKLLDYGFNEFYPYTVPGSSFNEFAVPVGTAGNVVGNAFFNYNEDVNILLPNSADPDSLQIIYERPEYFAAEEDAAGTAALMINAPNVPGMPEIALRIPMESVVRMDAVPVALAAMPEEDAATQGILGKLLRIALPIIAVGAFLLLALRLFCLWMRHQNFKRRRRIRQERIARFNRVQAEQARMMRQNITVASTKRRHAHGTADRTARPPSKARPFPQQWETGHRQNTSQRAGTSDSRSASSSRSSYRPTPSTPSRHASAVPAQSRYMSSSVTRN